MIITIEPSKRYRQKFVLKVNGEPITWNNLEQLITCAIAVEEMNNGKYPLRKRVRIISDSLKISTKKTKSKIHFNVETDL